MREFRKRPEDCALCGSRPGETPFPPGRRRPHEAMLCVDCLTELDPLRAAERGAPDPRQLDLFQWAGRAAG
jgi:hypothetical protein